MSFLAPTSAPTMSSAIEKTTAADGLRLLNAHSSIVIVMGAKLRRTEIMGTDSVRIAWRQRVAAWGHSAGAPTTAGQQRATRRMNQQGRSLCDAEGRHRWGSERHGRRAPVQRSRP
jgi:hypothetical protein